LEEEMVPLPDFDIKTNNVINEVFVTINRVSKRRNTAASLV
jgi:hypothetical protein